jgi:hypothetical protein
MDNIEDLKVFHSSWHVDSGAPLFDFKVYTSVIEERYQACKSLNVGEVYKWYTVPEAELAGESMELETLYVRIRGQLTYRQKRDGSAMSFRVYGRTTKGMVGVYTIYVERRK